MASRSLGTLTLDMLVKMGGFVQGMNQAQRVTDQRTKAMQKSLHNIENGFKGIGNAVASLATVVGVGLSFRGIIQQTINFQKEQAQLEAVLLSTGRAAEISKQQLNDMASSMSAVGGGSLFSEGEINQAQARLLSYTGIVGDEFPQAMQAAIDMATRLGMDVSSAAETVGRALDVPSQGLTALTRQGFRFTEEQKKLVQQLERTGRTAEAQHIILEQLTSAYGGAAAASRNTLEGSLQALRGSLGNLMTGGSGSFDGFKESIDNLVDTLNDPSTKEGFQAFVKFLADIASIGVKAGTVIADLASSAGFIAAVWVRAGKDNDELANMLRERQQILDDIPAYEAKLANTRVDSVVQETTERLKFLNNRLEVLNWAIGDISSFRLNGNPVTSVNKTDTAKPVINRPTTGGGSGGIDYARRWLEESQKAIQNSLQDFERDYARSMLAIEQMNEDGLISMVSFYDAQRSLLESQGQERVNAIDQQIAALQQYRAAAKNEAESYRATQQINDLYRQRIQIIEDNITAINKLGRDEVKALAELENKFRQVDLSLMEHRGMLVEVAAIRFDEQYADLLKLAQANDRLDIVKKIEELKQFELQATAFGKEAQNLQNIFSSLSNAEQMLAVTQQLGGVGEIAALRQLGNLRSSQLEAVNASLVNLRALLNAGESTPELVRQLEQLELQAAQLQAGLDPLAAKFADVFSKGMEDPIYDFISGTKTAAEAFTEMTNQIIADLARLAIQDSLTSLFGGSSSGGGIFGFISGLFANAKGGVHSGPDISALSNSILRTPTFFTAYAKGGVPSLNVAGEAGDEAIMPLTRTGNGDLGVKAVGQQLSEKAAGEQAFNTNIVINMADGGASTTISRDNQDAQARILAQSVDRAVKDCISREMMQGGVIWKMRNGR